METKTEHRLRWKAWLIPHAIVMLWLIYIGAMIWQHNLESVQPPQYDPLTYIQKAMHFWEAVEQGKLFNPLNLEPTNRPPGTILMSYPFGFSADFKGFLFRSIFFPILCVVFAVYMAAGIPRNANAGWGVASVAILFSAIPMFYALDYSELNPRPSFWGLVDNFQAGIAALAAAGFVKSLMRQSLVWLMWGAFLGSFTLLIKPSGLMIMAILGATWLLVVVVEWLWTRKRQQSNSNLYRYVIIGGIQTFLIYTAVVLLSFFSQYFSMQNFAYAKQALKIMEDVLKAPPSQIFSLVFDSAGVTLFLWIIGSVVLIIHYYFFRNEKRNPLSAKMLGLLLSIPLIWSLGAWYWLVVQAGGNQVRYFYPFLLMGAIFMIPISLHIFQYSHRWIRIAQLVLCFLPAINIGALLAMESPSIQWQWLCGVNISVAQDREEVNQAHAFLNKLRRQNRNANVYSFFSGVLPDVFVTVGLYEGMVKPDLPFFKTTSTVDWARGFIVRTDQLLEADYILVRKDLAWKTEKIVHRQIATYDLECAFFQTWLCGLNDNAGIKIESEGRVLRLLEIVDRKAFANAVESFVAAHSWRPEFMAANSQRHWSNEVEVSTYAKNPVANEINFEGIFMLHVLSLQQSKTGLQVEIWWEELRHEDANKDRHMFFHLVDQSGKILRDLYLSLGKYDPPFDDRRWRYGSITFERPLPENTTSLTFGIFRPHHEILMPSKGAQDWAERRVLVPLP